MENQELLKHAINTLCDVVKSTLGTNGRTVLYNTYDKENNKPATTKDGCLLYTSPSPRD
jgi:chaperonin GroEL (HSP60 family)